MLPETLFKMALQNIVGQKVYRRFPQLLACSIGVIILPIDTQIADVNSWCRGVERQIQSLGGSSRVDYPSLAIKLFEAAIYDTAPPVIVSGF